MITCQLTKLEAALDTVRKTHTKLKPADAALLTNALTLTGRHALALYEGAQFSWPDDFEKLSASMATQIEMVNEGIESTTVKRGAKTVEEEPVTVTVGLMPNLTVGEGHLEGRDDLKAKLSELLQDGVEFSYAPSDIMWQWALDRVNWSTVCDKDISRRIKIKASFTEGAVGIEMGTATAKKRPAKKVKKEEEAPETDVEVEAETEAIEA